MNKLPSDWQIKTINEVCNIYTGNSINKKKKEENFIGLKEGLNYIGTKDISFNNIIEYENGVKIPFKDLKDFKIAKSNTSLLCIEGGSAGRKIVFTNQDVCFGNKLCCFEAIEDEPKFIYFYLQSNYFLREFNSNIQGLIGGVNKENLKKIKIPIPPLDEQKLIASALSKIDAYLENTIKLIEEKERFKRGIAKKLLTCKEGENIPKARFKGFEDEWEIVKLGDIGTITATGVDKKINDNETPIKLLNYLDVFNRNKLYEKEISYMTTATEKQLEKCNIRKGDLFITPSSEDKKGIAKSSVAMEDFKNTVYSYHIIRVRFNKEIDLKFKSYMCDTDFFHRQAYRLCDGSGQRYFIKLDNFRNMEICIPKSIKEQEKIGGYLSLLDKEIDNLKKQKELIKEMKRGAMQKLLSGEVRLVDNYD